MSAPQGPGGGGGASGPVGEPGPAPPGSTDATGGVGSDSTGGGMNGGGTTGGGGPLASGGKSIKSGIAYDKDGTLKGKGNFTSPESGDEFTFFVGTVGGGDDGFELATALVFWVSLVAVALLIIFVAVYIARMPRTLRDRVSNQQKTWIPLHTTAFLLGHVLLTWADGAPAGFLVYLCDRHDLAAIFLSGDVMTKFWPLRIVKFLAFLAILLGTCVFFLSTYPGNEGSHVTFSDDSVLNSILYYTLTMSAGSAVSFAIRFGNVSARSYSTWTLIAWSTAVLAGAGFTLWLARAAVEEKFNYFATPTALRDDYVLMLLGAFSTSAALNLFVTQPLFLGTLYIAGLALYGVTHDDFLTHKLVFSGDTWCSFSTLIFARRWMRRCKVGRYREALAPSADVRAAAEPVGVATSKIVPGEAV